ncbi:MAG: tRNA uracil 4-sulfurtransferase ThiI [Thermodesulfobacteriota bacterium]
MGILVHYGELTLKGRNRSQFINKLAENIKGFSNGKINIYRDRLYAEGVDAEKIKNTFGISWYAEATIVEKNLDAIQNFINQNINLADNNIKSFGLFIKRSDKNFEYDSQQLAQILGKYIQDKFNLSVNLTNPDLAIYIEVAADVFIYFNKHRGLGGMPVGISGRVLSLLSGGIDSPVASFQIMKRGARVDFLHFHNLKSNNLVLKTKITSLLEILKKYQSGLKLYLIPFKYIHLELLKNNLRGYELVIFRYIMFKIASRLCIKNNYLSIITGDSLSQVASQTLQNIYSTYSSVETPVLSPLISFDKQEIIEIAKMIDTYDISIKDYNECCSLVAKSPRTKVKKDLLINIAGELDVDGIVEKSFNCIEEYDI